MDGPPPVEEDFSSLPVADRLAHKNWKARVSAYETLIKAFQNTASDTDPAFRPYLSNPDLLKKAVVDSNAVAQEKGVEAVLAFVKFAGETAARTREAIVPSLVDKCFGSTRAGTKTKAIEIVLEFVEVENGAAGVIADIMPGLAAKQPKVVAGCVAALKDIIKLFGPQVAPPTALLKSLAKIFSHTDKAVRAEGTLLAQAIYVYLGGAIQPSLGDLKPVQVKELNEGFQALDAEGKGPGTLKPERLTRLAAREKELAELNGGGQEEDGQADERAPPDPRDFLEAEDIASKVPQDFMSNLASSKWKDRKMALDDFLTALQATPKIKDSPYIGDLAKALAGKMTDANIMCVIAAAQCLEHLAKNLGSPFGRFRESTMVPMLERLKERKQNVTDAIGISLDAIFKTTALPDVIPDLLPFLTHKNPQVKEGTLKFLHRCLASTTIPPQPAQVKPLGESLAGLLGDGAESVRTEATGALGTLMKIVGERAMNPVVEPLDDLRKAKLKEAFDKATVKCKAGAPAAPKPAAAPSSKPPAKLQKAPVAKKEPMKEVVEDTPSSPPSSAPNVLKKKPAPSSSAPKKPAPAAAAAKTSGKAAPAPAGATDNFKYKHTPEDAEGLIAELIPSNIQSGLSDGNWKTRLATIDEEMAPWLDSNVESVDSEVVVRFIAKKGWNEKNFQVSSKLYGLLVMLAERCPSFGKSSAALCIGHLCDKMGDIKLKKPAGDTLIAFAEKTSLSFVLSQAYDPLSKQKAPKVLADAITWINQALTEFGIAGLALRALIDFLKTALKNSNAAVRSNATNALVTLKLFAGPGIKDFLEDLNPQLLATIQSDFDKAEGTPAPVPTRVSADVAAAPSGGGGGGQAGGADPMDDLFPRVDLDRLLAGTSILTDAKSDAWKSRKDALETLQSILDVGTNKRLKPNMGDIGQILKARVTDTNKVVQLLALDILTRIANGMNKPFDKYVRLFVVPVCTVLADQKANIRAAAVSTLLAMAVACEGIDAMVSGLTTALEATNPIQRNSLLGWLTTWIAQHPIPSSVDLSGWVSPIIGCLEDRNADVRKASQALLTPLIINVGFDKVLNGTNSLKPASRATVLPIIQVAKPATVAPGPKFVPSRAVPASAQAAPEEPRVDSPPPSGSAPKPVNGRLGLSRKPIAPISRPGSSASNYDNEPPPSAIGIPKKTVGIKRPVGRPDARVVATPVAPGAPFTGMNPEAKKNRLKDAARWIIESGPARKDLAESLQAQMEPHTSKELVGLLFSHDHNSINDNISGLGTIAECYTSAQNGEELYGIAVEDMRAILIANADLPLKYVSMKVHESQSNLVGKCLEVAEEVFALLRSVNYQLLDAEATCIVPTLIHKLGDAREPVRFRVQQIIQALPKVYAYSRIFQLLLDHGLKSKVAKTRQGTLDELASILKRSGIGACDPRKSFPVLASLIGDKDPHVRKSALSALSEAYLLEGDQIWNHVGTLSLKDKSQLEERLKRVPAPAAAQAAPKLETAATRLANGAVAVRPESPGLTGRVGGIPRPSSPAVGQHRSAIPGGKRAPSPAFSQGPGAASPSLTSRLPSSSAPSPSSPTARSKPLLQSRLGAPSARPAFAPQSQTLQPHAAELLPDVEEDYPLPTHQSTTPTAGGVDEISITISSILSSDPARSVDALKKIQKVLDVKPDETHNSPAFHEMSDHTEGLVETITLQMSHVFDRPEEIIEPGNFRLAKHLIQTLNAFCDHSVLAESLTVEILTSLLDELTLRLLQTDESKDNKVKDLSRFINMIILRVFSTVRRITVFRALFALLLQIVKPFPTNATTADSREAKVADLVLKCIWKLARTIPADLEKEILDPIELFPAIEKFLQSIPPNDWRARATNQVPVGDTPLRTVKVIIQHVVGHFGDGVYDQLSAAFDDPSATIVYPYVYRILNSKSATAAANSRPRSTTLTNGSVDEQRAASPSSSRPVSPPQSITSSIYRRRDSTASQTTSRSVPGGSSTLPPPPVEEPDPDATLLTIINHISSETSGAMHKEGITELHQFMKAYPNKKAKVEKMLEATGPAFRKYIARALASRAAEDQEREVVVLDTLSQTARRPDPPLSPIRTTTPISPRRSLADLGEDKALSRLHGIFNYQGSRTSVVEAESGSPRRRS